MKRAALGLLRVSGRLLVYKEAAADALLDSLQLLPRLNTSVAWDLAPAIAAQARARARPLLVWKRDSESLQSFHNKFELITPRPE